MLLVGSGKQSSPKDRNYIGGKIRILSFIVFKEIRCGETEQWQGVLGFDILNSSV
jgi:hypothetical protein